MNLVAVGRELIPSGLFQAFSNIPSFEGISHTVLSCSVLYPLSFFANFPPAYSPLLFHLPTAMELSRCLTLFP